MPLHGFLKYTFELNTSIFTSLTAVSIWLSAPTMSPLNDELKRNNLGLTNTTLMQHSASFLDPAPARARTLVGSSWLVFKKVAWMISESSVKLGDWLSGE